MRLTLEQIQDNAPAGTDPWLSPQAVAELTGLDVKWLAAAREGRKSLRGPAFIKIGEGRTSPIRYRLSAVISWMMSFEERDSTVMYRETGPWPASLIYALHHGSADQPGPFPSASPTPKAKSFKEWLNGGTNQDESECWPVVETQIGLLDAFLVMGAAGLILDGIRWISLKEWRETVG